MKEKEPSQDYIQGFNEGYILREHKPELALSLSLTKFPESEKEYSMGLKDGIAQRNLEMAKERGDLSAPKNINKDKDIDMER